MFFLLCLVIALLFNLPVQQVMPYVQLPNTIRVAGIDGTLLSGRAQEIDIDGFPIRELNYRYLPSCIPLLKICYRLQYERGELRAAYDLLNGDTEISDSLISYQVGELMPYMPNLLVRPAGRLELAVDELSFFEGKPAALSGKLLWRDLGIAEEGIDIDIGDIELDFTGNASQYDFEIRDLDASLDVQGDGQIGPGGEYEIDLRIGSQTGINPQVKSVLELVARNVGYNQYRLQQKGRLPPKIAQQLFQAPVLTN